MVTPKESTYDYIIVGSGAGGGPLAGNLAQAGYRVLLLEAGGQDEPPSYSVPVFHPKATEDPSLKWDFFVRHYECTKLSERDKKKFVKKKDGVLYPRAGTLGGCTAHHAMITVYPHNRDWDQIAELTGDESWRSENMRTYFERIERNNYRKIGRLLKRWFGLNLGRHGYDGWLPTNIGDPKLAVTSPRLLSLLLKSVKAAEPQLTPNPFRRLLRYVRSLAAFLDPNDWKLVKTNAQGVRFAPLSTHKGRRAGTREYIEQVRKSHPDFLHVRLGALVSKILFDESNRAIGVEYIDGERLYRAAADPQPEDVQASRKEVHACKEVILCAGAFNTPQLLKLSGIGPRAELAKHGIEVRVHRPGVGENLQDRYEVGVVSRLKQPFSLLDGATFKAPGPGEQPDPLYRKWQQGKGAYTTNGAVIAIIKKSDPNRPLPDLFCFGLVGYFEGYYPGYSQDAFKQPYFTWAVLKAHTENRAGTVKLRSADPRDTPLINFRYFEEGSDAAGKDLEAVVNGVKFVRALNRGLTELTEQEVVPGPGFDDDDDIAQFVKDNAWGHHASCSCQMGRADDEMAVVDSRFRVIGTTNLRIVDASIFPRIPGFFIVLPVYMISEKATDAILDDASGCGADPSKQPSPARHPLPGGKD